MQQIGFFIAKRTISWPFNFHVLTTMHGQSHIKLNDIFGILHLMLKEYTLQAAQGFMSQNREKTDSSNISYLQIPTGQRPIIREIIFKCNFLLTPKFINLSLSSLKRVQLLGRSRSMRRSVTFDSPKKIKPHIIRRRHDYVNLHVLRDP
jgi:hypothetical protein